MKIQLALLILVSALGCKKQSGSSQVANINRDNIDCQAIQKLREEIGILQGRLRIAAGQLRTIEDFNGGPLRRIAEAQEETTPVNIVDIIRNHMDRQNTIFASFDWGFARAYGSPDGDFETLSRWYDSVIAAEDQLVSDIMDWWLVKEAAIDSTDRLRELESILETIVLLDETISYMHDNYREVMSLISKNNPELAIRRAEDLEIHEALITAWSQRGHSQAISQIYS